MSDREALKYLLSDVSFSQWSEVQEFVEDQVVKAILSSDWLAAHDAEVLAATSAELFAGAGGLSMAVDRAFNARCAWFSEIDPAPSKVLAHRFPDVPNLGDVTQIDWATTPRIDILGGGFPCTDVSLAGRMKGMNGTRSGLWTIFADSIEHMQPEWVVIENVRGLLSTA